METTLLERVHEEFGADAFEATEGEEGVVRIAVPWTRSLEILLRLRDTPMISMRRLLDLTAIDRGAGEARFEVVYWLHSPALNQRMRVHVAVEDEPPGIDSAVECWPAAIWLEREVFDLFGITFRGHPDLRRIMLEPDFEGAPLRKDYARQPNLELPKETEG